MNPKLLSKNLCIVIFITLLGCSSEPGPDGLTSLVKITPEATGTSCTAGGFKVETGIDANRNSVLETSEIQNFVYVCNGLNGTNGTNGTNGSSGVNGTNGLDGSNGLTSLIKVSNEPTGTNCPSAGGNRIDTGVDDNANGTLESNEIDNTFYVCDGGVVNNGKETLTLVGDVTDAEAAQIIARDLGTATQRVKIINCSNLTTVDLSKLKSAFTIEVVNSKLLQTLNLKGLKSIIGGIGIARSPELQNLYLDSLEYVFISEFELGGESSIRGTKLNQLSLPSLTKLDGNDSYIEIDDNNQLSSITAPKLLSMLGVDFDIQSNTNLTSLAFPELVEASSIIIEVAPSLTTLSLPKLTHANTIFARNTGLTSITFPELVEVAGSEDYYSIQITDNPSLVSLSLPKLTKSPAVYIYTTGLTSLSFPLLASLNGLYISGNKIQSLNLPQLVSSSVISISETELSSLTLTTFTTVGYIDIRAKLSSSSVNSILANVVQVNPPITGRDVLLDMTPDAPPTGQGLTDKNTLLANGNNVSTD